MLYSRKSCTRWSPSKDSKYSISCTKEGKSILQVPNTGMSQYWSILEHFWCTSIAQKCDTYVFLEHASVIQKLTILEHKNGLVLSNTRVPVSGTWSILFPKRVARVCRWGQSTPKFIRSHDVKYHWRNNMWCNLRKPATCRTGQFCKN